MNPTSLDSKDSPTSKRSRPRRTVRSSTIIDSYSSEDDDDDDKKTEMKEKRRGRPYKFKNSPAAAATSAPPLDELYSDSEEGEEESKPKKKARGKGKAKEGKILNDNSKSEGECDVKAKPVKKRRKASKSRIEKEEEEEMSATATRRKEIFDEEYKPGDEIEIPKKKVRKSKAPKKSSGDKLDFDGMDTDEVKAKPVKKKRKLSKPRIKKDEKEEKSVGTESFDEEHKFEGMDTNECDLKAKPVKKKRKPSKPRIKKDKKEEKSATRRKESFDEEHKFEGMDTNDSAFEASKSVVKKRRKPSKPRIKKDKKEEKSATRRKESFEEEFKPKDEIRKGGIAKSPKKSSENKLDSMPSPAKYTPGPSDEDKHAELPSIHELYKTDDGLSGILRNDLFCRWNLCHGSDSAIVLKVLRSLCWDVLPHVVQKETPLLRPCSEVVVTSETGAPPPPRFYGLVRHDYAVSRFAIECPQLVVFGRESNTFSLPPSIKARGGPVLLRADMDEYVAGQLYVFVIRLLYGKKEVDRLHEQCQTSKSYVKEVIASFGKMSETTVEIEYVLRD